MDCLFGLKNRYRPGLVGSACAAVLSALVLSGTTAIAEDVTETWRDGVTIASDFDSWFRRLRANLREPDLRTLDRRKVVAAYRIFFARPEARDHYHEAVEASFDIPGFVNYNSDFYEHVVEPEIVARVEILADGSARLTKTYYDVDHGQPRRTILHRVSRSLGAEAVTRLAGAGKISEIKGKSKYWFAFSCIEPPPCLVKNNLYLIEAYFDGGPHYHLGMSCDLRQGSAMFNLIDTAAEVMQLERPHQRGVEPPQS